MRKAADTRAAAKALEVQKLSEQLEDFKKAASSQGGDFGCVGQRCLRWWRDGFVSATHGGNNDDAFAIASCSCGGTAR